MRFVISTPLVLVLIAAANSATDINATHQQCRTQPGDSSFPTTPQLSRLNSSIEGRLITVIPSALFCKQRDVGCTNEEWADSVFRSNIPGAMLAVNWEQDYTSHPPSLCFRNSTVCGQGNAPVYAVNATSAAHIQAGIRFAQKHNLKVAIKASGHDLLGRSTAKNSLLLWTRYMEKITFHDSFKVGGKNKGSAVTVGSGVGLHTIYQAAKARGKIFVGGMAANVVAAGGYVQGAGHSPLGPLLGLAADNALEFKIVIANGDLITANEVSHPELFWALRGGGPGSWGVIVSATLRTFPTFNVAHHTAIVSLNSSAAAARIVTLHAQHVFDWDDLHPGQAFVLQPAPPAFVWVLDSYFPNTSLVAANASIAPFMAAVAAQGFNIVSITLDLVNANDALSPASVDAGGTEGVLGSRLIPANVYRYNPAAVGKAYKKLLDTGPAMIIVGILLAGRVSRNADIHSAVNPKWRTAKTHIIVSTGWVDDTPPDIVESIRQDMTHNKVPVLAELAGPDSASYSNEADVREPAFRTTFFGPNYARLSAVKAVYDPKALFIVGAGVGSEKWDEYGLCRVSA